MINNQAVSEHYLHGNLLKAIENSLAKLGKTIDTVTIEDLAPVDDFHIGGRLATKQFLSQLNFSQQDHVLDVGCGMGGAARYVVSKYNNHVTGIDLAQEYIDTGKELCSWVKLDNKITLQQRSALSMPFPNETFDGGYMMHVGMNIEEKTHLFAEISRVLRPGSSFGVYDIMRNKDGQLTYPVPWAKEESISRLATPDQYKKALWDAGFKVSKEINRRDFALDFFKMLHAKTEGSSGPPPLGLHILMKLNSAVKIKNMVEGIAADLIQPVEIFAQKF